MPAHPRRDSRDTRCPGPLPFIAHPSSLDTHGRGRSALHGANCSVESNTAIIAAAATTPGRVPHGFANGMRPPAPRYIHPDTFSAQQAKAACVIAAWTRSIRDPACSTSRPTKLPRAWDAQASTVRPPIANAAPPPLPSLARAVRRIFRDRGAARDVPRRLLIFPSLAQSCRPRWLEVHMSGRQVALPPSRSTYIISGQIP